MHKNVCEPITHVVCSHLRMAANEPKPSATDGALPPPPPTDATSVDEIDMMDVAGGTDVANPYTDFCMFYTTSCYPHCYCYC